MAARPISQVGDQILKEHRLLTLLNGDVFRQEPQWRPVVPLLLELWALQADDAEHTSIARRQEIVAYIKLMTLDIDPDLQHADLGELATLRP